VATRRIRLPQRGQARTSIPNARRMRAARVHARGLLFTPAPSGPAAAAAVEAVGSGATRPYSTTRARQRAWEAVTFY